MKRKALSMMLATAMIATLFAGCGNAGTGNTSSTTDAGSKDAVAATEKADDKELKNEIAAGGGSVYYLNFKPEQDAD